jgi:hypothetical protein
MSRNKILRRFETIILLWLNVYSINGFCQTAESDSIKNRDFDILPADRAYSLYKHMRRARFEKVSSFEKALEEEKKRLNSDDFKNNNPEAFHNFLYFNSGKYGAQIDRYLKLFDKSQFLFLTYDELVSNSEALLNKVCNFLAIEPFSFTEDEYENKGYGLKSTILADLISIPLISNRVSVKLKIKRSLRALNRTPVKPINPKTKAQLMEDYQEDQQLLHHLTGIKFT